MKQISEVEDYPFTSSYSNYLSRSLLQKGMGLRGVTLLSLSSLPQLIRDISFKDDDVTVIILILGVSFMV
jgi:hypothetical protein